MMLALRTAGRVLTLPIWALWKCYGVLWWAFSEPTARRAGASASIAPPGAPPPTPGADDLNLGQTRAFEVVDSTPPTPRPEAALKGGFAGTLGVSVLAALISRGLVASQDIGPNTGWLLWGWATVLTAVASLMVVRHVDAVHRARQPRTRWQKVKATVGGVGSACVSVGGGIAGACRGTVKAAKAGGRGAAWAWSVPPVAMARRGVRGLAATLRERARGRKSASTAAV